MTDCVKSDDIITRWVRDGRLDGDTESWLRSHFTACTKCRDRFGELQPLLARDARASIPGAADVTADTEFPAPPDDLPKIDTAALASQISIRMQTRRLPGRQGPSADRKKWILAAAAILVCGVTGLLLFHLGIVSRSSVVITFQLVAPEASAVRLVGDFSDWSSRGFAMRDPDRDGVWVRRIRLQVGSAYRYNFVIDDERWISDPSSLIEVRDEFGGNSSIIQL